MKMQKAAVAETFLFRLARAVLPEPVMLAWFGQLLRVPVRPTRAAQLRRGALRRAGR
jgi:hypothetical protein